MPDPHDEQFVQRRLLIASLLSALVIMAYFYFSSLGQPPLAPPPAGEPEQTAVEEPAPPPAPADEQKPAAPAPGDDPISGETEREIVVETATSRITLSNRGAVARSWVLTDYRNARGEQLDLVHPAGAEEYGYPLSLRAAGGREIAGLDDALFAVEAPDHVEGPAEIRFVYSDGSRTVRKTLHFPQTGYVFELSTEVIENGAPQPHFVAWSGGFGDTAHPNDSVYSQLVYFDPREDEIEQVAASDLEDERIAVEGDFPFAGVEDLFFAVLFLPEAGQRLRLEATGVEIAPLADEVDRETFAAAAFGGDGRNDFRVYVGPKDVDALQAVEPRLRQVVDFGFFGFVAEPLFLLMRWVHSTIVDNWGWTIVVVTIFINVALFPLKWKSTKSMKRMQQLQPLIKQINEKYKGLSMRDPKKAQQNQELMELYKKYNVNPVGGCLPMLLQMPFFFAFYNLLTVAIEIRQADWLWVEDLSRPEQIPIRILPLAMIGSQFWMQALTPTPSVDPAQARIMRFMPLMMGFIFYNFQSGLVLYWLTSNIVGIVQQVAMNKLPGDEIEIEQPRRRGRRKK